MAVSISARPSGLAAAVRGEHAAANERREVGGPAILLRFFLLSWLLTLVVTSRNFAGMHWSGGGVAAFVLTVWLTYSVVYLVPAMALAATARLLLGGAPWRAAADRREWIVRSVALLGAFAVQATLLVDAMVHGIFGFHLNGFVWNLLTTPGGLESMDSGGTTWIGLATRLGALFTIEAGFLVAALKAERLWSRLRPRRPRRAATWAALSFLALAGTERIASAASDLAGYRPILGAEETLPFYLRLRARKLASRLGLECAPARGPELSTERMRVAYPRAPLALAPDRRRWNVVWLVAESLRADALDPEVMPATTAFASRGLRFLDHYSGGNGTRMGVFSMFYGLYGASWFPFLAARRGPVLVDRLVDDGYATLVQTSATFTCPEFDQTVFARIPAADRFEADGREPGWQRDRALVGRMIDWIGRRDPQRPFFAFMFFESPHAQYRFPDESVIRRPYLESVDYTALDPARDAPLLRNRYLNAVHHLDTQFARVFDALQAQGLLDSTLVVVTGDHGEEFMEKGRWGHNSTFSEEQTRVPLILRFPGVAPRVIDTPTSHLDLPATLLARLGVTNPASDYSLGNDLLGDAHRDHVVIADWNRLCVRDARSKGIFPVNQPGFAGCEITTSNDAPDPDEAHYLSTHTALLSEILRGLSRFSR